MNYLERGSKYAFFQKKGLDERQLLIRGNIFKHGFFVLTFLIFCNAMLNVLLGFKWTTNGWSELTIVLFGITICCIEFIYYDIYPLTEQYQKYSIYCIGIFGCTSIVLCLYEIIFENIPIIVNGNLTANTLGIIYGLMFLTIFIIYICKTIRNQKYEKED